MNKTTEKALYAALDIAAKYQISWVAGREAFIEAQLQGRSINQSICEAIDATNCEPETWIKASEAFYDTMKWNADNKVSTIERWKRNLQNRITTPAPTPPPEPEPEIEIQNNPEEFIEIPTLRPGPGGGWEPKEWEEHEDPQPAKKKGIWGWFVLAALLIAMLAIGINHYNKTPVPTPAVTKTSTTWKMVEGDYGANSRWISEGVAEIKAAKTDKEAKDAASIWLEKVKTDPNLLVGAAKFFLNKDIEKASLVDSNGYATDKAVQLLSELQMALGTAKTITAEEAPINGYNSGVHDGTVVQSATSGITGDRKAVRILLDDGTQLWIMARCGNVATTKPTPDVPKGPTDNPPAPKPTPKPNPTPIPTVLEEKDPSKDVLVNPDVSDWKKDDPSEPLHTVTYDDGAKVSNGLQEEPWVDAKEAKKKAIRQNRVDHDNAIQEAVTNGAGIVDSNQNHVTTTKPGW